MNLKDRVALITGSSRGIGRAIALKLARHGADIFINYRSNERSAIEVMEEIRSLGRNAWIISGDVRKYEDIKNIFQEIESTTGKLDILVNNAALGSAKPVLKMKPNHWDLTMETCARSVLLCSQTATPLMKYGFGRIINLSSLGSHKYIPEYVAIGSAKAAIESLTRFLAVELAEKGIVVNCVSGGMIETDTLTFLGDSIESQKKRYLELCPMKRLGKPEDIANIVAFLCSEDAKWIVGQTIIADGGYSLW